LPTTKNAFGQFLYGVCYYPEHWHPSRHASDIARIADAGFNVVRLGEGAWSYWEPREGQYQFDLFDNVIDLCRRHGLKVILGTPTYAGPAWVAHQYPEVLRWNYDRVPMAHGSRRNYNYTSPKYLELSDRICTALAAHYATEKQVVAWQLDNEFNCHMDVSYAPSDTLAWRRWLRRKYKSLDKLNAAWGTAFWSQTYNDWDQIDLPHPTSTYHNPTALLDESRFISDTVCAFARRQADILRSHNRDWVITHNGLFGNVNGPDLAAELDVFCHDQYPLFNGEGDWPGYHWGLQQARSLSFPFGILEQQAGPGGQMAYLLRTPRPGQVRLWAWQSVAHGAKLVSYFRWRTAPYGSEQHWHGILDQDDRDNRRLAEVKLTGDEMRRLPQAFFDAPPARAVAIWRDYDSETNDKRVNTYVKDGAWDPGRWDRAISRQHVPVDQVWADTDLDGYVLLVAPHPKMVTKAVADKLTAFVRGGGTLVLGAQAGLQNANGHVVEHQPPPGLLAKLAGVEVEDWTTLGDTETRDAQLVGTGGQTVAMNRFVERLRPTTAVPLAFWTGGDPLLGGAPAVTVNTVGKGKVYYVGGYTPQAAVDALATGVLDAVGLEPVVDAGPEVEVIERGDAKRRYLVLMNHVADGQHVYGLGRGKVLVGDGEVTPAGELALPAYGVAVVELR